MNIIDTNDQLALTCTKIITDLTAPTVLPHCRYIAVDTEFYRDVFYYPLLCLVQIAYLDEVVIVDTLSPHINDFSPLTELLSHPEIIKVFHSGRQDVEALWQTFRTLPHPIFDTQIAIMALGLGHSLSYHNLVQHYLHKTLDKSLQHAEWHLRPLSSKHLQYAANDVIYLHAIYKIIHDSLQSQNRLHWLDEEFADLLNTSHYDINPADIWQRYQRPHDNLLTTSVLRTVSAWREQLAQARNKPRGHILKDETLHKISQHKPHSLKDLQKLVMFKDPELSRGLLAAVEAGMRNIVKAEDLKTEPLLSPNQVALYESLKVLLRNRSVELNIAEKLIATKQDLHLLIMQPTQDLKLTRGWRWEVFGQEALALCQGNRGPLLEQDQ